MTPIPSDADPGFEVLAGERYLSLTTFRRSGDGVATPVWFALLDGPRLVVHTEAASGKAKRLRADPACTVAPCDVRGRVHGPEVAARARLLDGEEDAEQAASARRALARTYGWQWRVFQSVGAVRRRLGRGHDTIELELHPAKPPPAPDRVEPDEPDGS